ncbi:MAG: SDR family oxidoreductase [Acidimicrobiia bacterium]|nr:SDR family oxidoreductase [Acidimicrobiia bacterium]
MDDPAEVVLITGGRGIAAAVAHGVAAVGKSVFVVSQVDEEVSGLCREISHLGGRADGVVADLTDEDAATAAFDRCLDVFNRLDGAVAVAGGSGRRFGDGPVGEIPLEGWQQTIAINMTPMFLTVREGVRAMDNGGSIVVVSSVLATHPSSLFVTHAYAAAKASAHGFVRSVAARHARDRIRVNVIAPGLVDTQMARRAASDPDTVAYVTRKQPLAGGLLPPESPAALAVFLLGDGSRHITGQIIEVDGGWGVTETDPIVG